MAIYAAIGATEQTALEQVGGTTGGGGATIIPNGGNLNGTYQGNVLCEGVVTMTGTVTVEGDLLVLDTFTNGGGYNLTVRGDLNARQMEFSNDDPAETAGSITVDGDFWFYVLNYVQSGGVSSLLRVGGNLLGSAGGFGNLIDAHGGDGTDGANIIVYGDLTATSVNTSGGPSTLAANAGDGGNITVYGDATLSQNLEANGGDSDDPGHTSGNGGAILIYGDLMVGIALSAHGGQGDEALGGNGGSLEVYGNFTTDEVEMYGGNCDSTSNLHASGQGGSLEVNGDFVCQGYCNLNGGDRSGVLALANSLTSPDAGSLTVRGNLTMQSDLSMNGGDITTNLDLGTAGNGGSLNIRGSGVFGDDLRAYGGDNSSGDGGDGGELNVEGNLTVDDELETYGGDGGGVGVGAGGAGGDVSVRGSAELGYVDLSGGNGFSGNGGNAGELDVNANLTLDDFLSLSGGTCDSTNPNHVAGGGKDLNVGGNAVVTGNVQATGGNRIGGTTVSNTGVGSADGGTIYVDGNAVFDTIDLSGGDVSTDYPQAPGGNGGGLVLGGSFTGSGDIRLDGGDGVANTGGTGGNVFARGLFALSTSDFYSSGGDSNNSILGGDATTNGSGAASFGLAAGGVLRTLWIQDGGGPGAAPIATVDVILAHFCTFGEMVLTDRPEVTIRADSQMIGIGLLPATLKIHEMLLKQTLNNSDGTATGNISAILSDSIFTSDVLTWYAHTGIAV